MGRVSPEPKAVHILKQNQLRKDHVHELNSVDGETLLTPHPTTHGARHPLSLNLQPFNEPKVYVSFVLSPQG